MGLTLEQAKQLEELRKKINVTYHEGTRDVHEVFEEFVTDMVRMKTGNKNIQISFTREKQKDVN